MNGNDIKCLKWCLVRYLNCGDHKQATFKKVDKDFARKLDFKDIKIPINLRDIHKLRTKIVSASLFLVMKIEKITQSTLPKIHLKEMSIYY